MTSLLAFYVLLSPDKGFTALHYAAAGGHAECFHCLLQHGASLGVCNHSGENALDIARKHGKPRVIGKAGTIAL